MPLPTRAIERIGAGRRVVDELDQPGRLVGSQGHAGQAAEALGDDRRSRRARSRVSPSASATSAARSASSRGVIAPAGSFTMSRARATAAATRAPRSRPWLRRVAGADHGERLELARASGSALYRLNRYAASDAPSAMAWAARARSRPAGAAASRVVATVSVPPRGPHEGGRRPAEGLGRRPSRARPRRGRSRSPDPTARPAPRPACPRSPARRGSSGRGRRRRRRGSTRPAKTGVPTAPASAGTSPARVKVIGMRLLLVLGARGGRAVLGPPASGPWSTAGRRGGSGRGRRGTRRRPRPRRCARPGARPCGPGRGRRRSASGRGGRTRWAGRSGR